MLSFERERVRRNWRNWKSHWESQLVFIYGLQLGSAIDVILHGYLIRFLPRTGLCKHVTGTLVTCVLNTPATYCFGYLLFFPTYICSAWKHKGKAVVFLTLTRYSTCRDSEGKRVSASNVTRNSWLDLLQDPHQLSINSLLSLLSFPTSHESTRFRDYTVRHVLPMAFLSGLCSRE